MAISKRKDAEVRREIKMAVAKDPFSTTRRLAETLYHHGFRSQSDKTLSHEYVCKVARKVHAESIYNLDQTEIKTRIAQTQARFNLAFQKLSDIAYGESDPAAQIVALRTLMEMDLKLLSAEMDAGLYERKIEKVKEENHQKSIPPEHMERIMTAFRNYGIVRTVKAVPN